MFNIVYSRKNQYEPSRLKISCHKDFSLFVERIREESKLRQYVEVDGKIVIFGIEGPIVFPAGKFWSVSAEVKDSKWGKHYVLVSPSLQVLINRRESFLRLDSGCFSGMVLGDISCDCLDQLRKAQQLILKEGGIIIHSPGHDGRGWREEYKMANQRIIDECKVDTIKAGVAFYGNEKNVDCRTYDDCVLILKALGFPRGYKFILGTKNPNKIEALIQAGFKVNVRPIEVNKRSFEKNLKAKYAFWNGSTARRKIKEENI